MAAIAVSTLSTTTGAKPSLTDLSALGTSHTAPIGNGRNRFLVVENTNAATRTVTIDVQGTTAYGQDNPDPVYTVGATTGVLWIPLLKEYDSGSANTPGSAIITLSAAAGVSAKVVELP